MIRNFNYTGRVKIDSAHVKIDTYDNDSGITEFDCELDLSSYDFPDEAKVIVEPYRAHMRMRFEFGSVGKPEKPEKRELTDIPKTDIPLFTVKIVEPESGKLLGYNDRLHTNQNKENEIKDYLFPIDYSDLGNRLYEVHFSELPTLRLNNKVNEFNEKEYSSSLMISLIYPSALNAVLNRIAYVNNPEDDEE